MALLDWEPQGSLTLWWVMRQKPDNPLLIRDADDPVEAVANLGDSFDWVFLDTPPSGMDQISRAVEASDLVVIPVQASAFDLAAVRPVVAACTELQKPFAFVLTREHPRREALNNSAAVHLKKMGLLLPERVQERTAYVSALGLGKTGPEHPGQPAGARGSGGDRTALAIHQEARGKGGRAMTPARTSTTSMRSSPLPTRQIARSPTWASQLFGVLARSATR